MTDSLDQVKQQEKRALGDIAKTYDDFAFDTLLRGYMMRSIEPFLRPGKWLELGCFHGDFTALLAPRTADLTVVDGSAEFLAFTRQRVGDGPRYLEGLFEDVALGAEFDSVFLMHCLEHLMDPVAVLTRAKSFLAPRGRAFLVVPNGMAPSRQIAVKMGLLPHNTALTPADIKHGHRRTYTFDTLEEHARGAGMRIVHRGGIFFKPLANFQFDKLIGGDVLSDGYMEGCYQLGFEYPQLCASIFLVCEA
jgi:2-polyprenyl-3-methyl-5-hydroxy-6-metoxy-1,4-benzoquinol methylase